MQHPEVPLYDYQKKWLRDRSRFKLLVQPPQTGKTFIATRELVDSCVEAAAKGERRRWFIFSQGERQAKEAMDEVKRHARAYQLAIEELEYDWESSSGYSYKALEVVLPGGSRITALPASPDTVKGFNASVLLDDFAFHADSHKIWAAIFPAISAGQDLRITSTPNPNRKNNKFYDLARSADPIWSKHFADIYTAIADG